MVEKILTELSVSRRYWNYLLLGERNASPTLALRIEKKMGIPRDVFVFGSSKKRKAAFKRYLKDAK